MMFSLIFVICVLTPGILGVAPTYSAFTQQLLDNNQNFANYYDYVQYLSYSLECESATSSIVQSADSYSTAVKAFYESKNYFVDYCTELETLRQNTMTSLQTIMQADFEEYYDKIANEIEYAYTKANTILANKACDQMVADEMHQAYQMEAQNLFNTGNAYVQILSGMTQMIPVQDINTIYSDLSQNSYDNYQQGDTVEVLKQYELVDMASYARQFKNGCEDMLWFFDTFNHDALDAVFHDLQTIGNNYILRCQARSCSAE